MVTSHVMPRRIARCVVFARPTHRTLRPALSASLSVVWSTAWSVVLSLVLTLTPSYAQDASQPKSAPESSDALVKLVERTAGELPIILSAPHGGALAIPGAKVRQGEGLERKPGGFVTARDTGTEELARQLIAAIEKKLGKKPYAVINRAHRRFMDPNRPAEQAYEDPAARQVYETYHDALDQFCRKVKESHQGGLLLDLHGQGSRRDTVFRGTHNGLTVSLLRQRFGPAAHQGDASLFGLMKQRGFVVYPDPMDGKEQSGFLGGFIVKNYGSHDRYGVDAMQLEFGGLYRVADNRASAADALADAVAAYAQQYLKITLPQPLGEPRRFRPVQPATEKPSGKET